MAERLIDKDYEKIILGIDPGTNLMGYGVLGCNGNHMEMLSLGVITLKKYKDHGLKLKRIFERCLALIDSYHPDEMALEAPFFGKNVQSMLKLGRAQGVAMAAALYRDIPIFEYAPRRIKQSITGKGAADKIQVAKTLQNILKFDEIPKDLDATDGLAVAVCHFFTESGPKELKGSGSSKSSKKKSSSGGWSSFIKNNPGRVK